MNSREHIEKAEEYLRLGNDTTYTNSRKAYAALALSHIEAAKYRKAEEDSVAHSRAARELARLY